ncbi:MAG: hypothetical protein ACLVEE_15385 [Phocaeicola vulgatus]
MSGRWESSKTPYEVNTMVALAGCVFYLKVKTSNPPIKVARVQGEPAFIRKKKDGGYILAGKSSRLDTCAEDWEMLLDWSVSKGEVSPSAGEIRIPSVQSQGG